MADETDDFTPDEKAYFESGGTTEAPIAKEATSAPSEAEETAPAAPEQEAAEETGEAAPKRDEKVPLATLLEERKNAKEARQRLEAIEKSHAILEDRWNTMLRASEAGKPKEQTPEEALGPRPDPQHDIFAAAGWDAKHAELLRARLDTFENQQKETQQQQAEQQRQQQLETTISTYWTQDAKEFTAKAPDFDKAAGFLSEQRHKQLAAMSRFNPRLATVEGRNAQINAELRDIIVQSAQNQVSPAEAVYAMAKEWGYAPAQPEADDASKQVEDLAAAVSGSKSLSNASGGRSVEVNAKAIADMSDREFEAYMTKPENVAKFERMLGR